MLHALRFSARPPSHPVLDAMFAARKSVFVDLLKWDVPVVDGRFEMDQFDDAHAHYLVLTDREGDHLGSARLLPSTRPHILDTLYPGLCDDPPPRATDIFEITRFCLDRALPARDRRAVRDTLVRSLVDHALGHRIRGYTAIAETAWLRQILAFGWHCRPLGSPTSVDGRILGALSIAIDTGTPAALARAGIVASQFLLDAPIRAAA